MRIAIRREAMLATVVEGPASPQAYASTRVAPPIRESIGTMCPHLIRMRFVITLRTLRLVEAVT